MCHCQKLIASVLNVTTGRPVFQLSYSSEQIAQTPNKLEHVADAKRIVCV